MGCFVVGCDTSVDTLWVGLVGCLEVFWCFVLFESCGLRCDDRSCICWLCAWLL